MINDPEYERWLRTVPAEITQDTLWRMTAYRYALYAMSRAQADVPFFEQCRATRPHVDQLLPAVGAISANLEEGYSAARRDARLTAVCVHADHPDPDKDCTGSPGLQDSVAPEAGIGRQTTIRA